MKISKVQFAQYCNLFRSIELFLPAVTMETELGLTPYTQLQSN